MINLASWNIRGLNPSLKQNEVQNVIQENGLNMCAILESHVELDRINLVCNKVFKEWEWVSNAASCADGNFKARIIVGWDSNIMSVNVLHHIDQVMHLQIFLKELKVMLFVSMVYAANYYVHSRRLWENLSMHKCVVKDAPWVIMGDFNTTLHLDERNAGTSKVSIDMKTHWYPMN